jgi:hypothetical protein
LNIKAGQSYEDAGYMFENEKFRLNGNYYFSVSGINFVYNPYEIASYAQGQIEFYIPYKALKPIIDPDGPLGWILK